MFSIIPAYTRRLGAHLYPAAFPDHNIIAEVAGKPDLITTGHPESFTAFECKA